MIPEDIQALVLSFVSPEDTECSLGLVSRFFHKIITKRLYTNIIIGVNEIDRLLLLSKHLSSSLGSLIQSLVVLCLGNDLAESCSIGLAISSVLWFSTSLKSLTIFAPLPHIGPAGKAVAASIRQLTTLTHLSVPGLFDHLLLRGFGFPPLELMTSISFGDPNYDVEGFVDDAFDVPMMAVTFLYCMQSLKDLTIDLAVLVKSTSVLPNAQFARLSTLSIYTVNNVGGFVPPEVALLVSTVKSCHLSHDISFHTDIYARTLLPHLRDLQCTMIHPDTFSAMSIQQAQVSTSLSDGSRRNNLDDLCICAPSNLEVLTVCLSEAELMESSFPADSELRAAFPDLRYLSIEVEIEDIEVSNEPTAVVGALMLTLFDTRNRLPIFVKLRCIRCLCHAT